MDAYNKLRGAMGFPVDYELGAAISKHHEFRRKAVYEATKNFVVKITCYKAENGIGLKPCGFFNGFFYNTDTPLVLTSGHIDGFNGASHYKASFFYATSHWYECDLQLVKTGPSIGQQTTSDGKVFNAHDPDVAVFSCDQSSLPPHPPRPFAAPATVGDTVYVVGFKGIDEAQLTFSEGVVSYQSVSSMTVTAYADAGFSGCPVLNMDGFLVGMVVAGDGFAIKQVKILPAQLLHAVLVISEPVLPGLSG